MGSNTELLITHNLSKRFPGVLAVDDVDFSLRTGEIVALLGQNGAGKSTLIQILAGVYPSGTYTGSITLNGNDFSPTSVSSAEDSGIALVPQEVNVAPDLTVAQNMYLNAEPTRFGLTDVHVLNARAKQVLADFGVVADPATLMGELDLATQQLVIIARALSKNVRVLILDEPTAALTEKETQRLFHHMRLLRERGVSCIFVSHRLTEVFTIADRIMVMRDGKLRGTYITSETSRENIVNAMLGQAIKKFTHRVKKFNHASANQVALSVKNLSVWAPDKPDRLKVDDLSFSVHKGEILGLFGLLGSGCGITLTSLFGASSDVKQGEMIVHGQKVDTRHPSDAIQRGIGLMAQDRRETLLLEHTLNENVALASLKGLSHFGFLDVTRMRKLAADSIRSLQIKAPSVDTLVGNLSGGNQQKAVIGRWLTAGVNILFLIDPTRGVDIGARAEINNLWSKMSDEGYAIVLFSSEVEELVEVCDRVLVLHKGKLVSEHSGNDLTEERLLSAATGF